MLLTYPVAPDRLDIYSQFLTPAAVVPKQHKTSETTEIMLQMVACQRGVAALPRCQKLPLDVVRLGEQGIAKQIYLGTREGEEHMGYLNAFIELARSYQPPA